MKPVTYNLACGCDLPRPIKSARRKMGVALGYGMEFPEIWSFHFNISETGTAEASDFEFGMQLGFATAYHKITPREKSGWFWARGALQNFGFPYNNFCNGWG